MSKGEKVSTIEKQFGSKDIEVDLRIDSGLGGIVKVPLNWDIVDSATAEYAEILKEFDFSLIMKDLVSRYSKNTVIQIMPMAGNVAYNDKQVGFAQFYGALEEARARLSKKRFDAGAADVALKEECKGIVEYLLSGKHENEALGFSGWKRAYNFAKSKKKRMFLGVLSVDIPQHYKNKDGEARYRPSGTQHYVSYAYETSTRKLFLFDSASKNPTSDKSEVYYILKFAFEELEGGGVPVEIVGMRFPYILQPGAGDQQHENERSYNNQNVFCHTWSLWFGTLVAMFFDGKKGFEGSGLVEFFTNCAHRDNLLNLAMIKRFAFWLSSFLANDAESSSSEARSPKRQRAYDKAVRENDAAKLHLLHSQMYIQQNKLDGLKYIWNYKLDKPLRIEDVCVAGKVKVDVPYVESEIAEYTVAAFDELIKKKRCPSGKVLNEKTKRCKVLNA